MKMYKFGPRGHVSPAFPYIRQLLLGGVTTYNFAKCSKKLQEVERIWTPGDASKILLCRSATARVSTQITYKHFRKTS